MNVISKISSRDRLAMAALCVVLLVFGVTKMHGALSTQTLRVEWIQIAALPALFLFWGAFRIVGFTLPRMVFLMMLLSTGTIVMYSYVMIGGGKNTLILSRFEGDPYEIIGRKYRVEVRDAARRVVSAPSMRVNQYHGVVRKESEAIGILKRSSGVPMMVWGDTNWLHITFAPGAIDFVGKEIPQKWLEVAGLQMVTEHAGIMIPYSPMKATVLFIGRLFSSLLMPRDDGTSSVVPGVRELSLRALGSLMIRWGMNSHTALPWWVLGNYHMAVGLRDGGFEQGELDCAYRAYSRAIDILSNRGDAELLAASLNNRGILSQMFWLNKGDKADRGRARRDWSQAIRVAASISKHGGKGKSKAGVVARQNLSSVSQKTKETSLKKHRKRHS